jgi:hypothetical protein
MGITASKEEHDHVYISCLTYLAAEAERDNKHAIATILKAATAHICEWLEEGDGILQSENNEFVDSLTAAFAFVLQHNALSDSKKNRMIDMLNELNRSKLN